MYLILLAQQETDFIKYFYTGSFPIFKQFLAQVIPFKVHHSVRLQFLSYN